MCGGDDFPLGDAIDRVEVAQTLDAVLIALVHAVEADEAGPAGR